MPAHYAVKPEKAYIVDGVVGGPNRRRINSGYQQFDGRIAHPCANFIYRSGLVLRRLHAVVFALLFFIESIARTILLTVVPLQAYRVLGDAQWVSSLYFAAGLIGFAGSLTLPWLVRRLRRRRVFSLGALTMALAVVLFTREDTLGLSARLALMAFATSCPGISMNLYVMDHIQRRDLNRVEPMRMFLSASAWAVGPWLGVWLGANVQVSAPFVLTMASSAATLGFSGICA